VRVDVLLFASLEEAHGSTTIEIEIADGATASDVVDAVRAASPGLAGLLASVRVACDHEVRDAHAPVLPAREIALIPPVSGG